ncbi:hypothetical protein GLGCALEP_00856 [Pseudomonas sp. MM221]|nr:hypothetical protein DBADOPDK_00835 [Pseudomonas sp. MM223]CAI3794062.1 hypothetical protein GLGCALEP_00856 [Pseudomonas sp. MM221]
MIVSILDPWNKVRGPHTIFLTGIIDKFLNPARKLRKGEQSPLAITKRFVKDIRDLVTSEKITDIHESISIYNKYKIQAKRSQARFIRETSKVFNYTNFCVKKKGWDAYKFCGGLAVKICPYCQQLELPTLLMEKVNRGFRPALDHFFHKDKYPHLALSLVNLIPSCTTCNSNLKGEIDFFENLHLHPYFDSENIDFKFHRLTGELFIWEDIHDLEEFALSTEPNKACNKTKKSIETFMIDSRYALDNIKAEALAYAHAKLDWEETKNNDQIAIVRGFRHKEVLLTQFDRANYKNLRLGKLRADIYDGLS